MIFLLHVFALTSCANEKADPQAADLERLSSLTWASDETWNHIERAVCDPSALDVCTLEDCSPQEPNVQLIWRPMSDMFERCTATGCDTYQPTKSYSGVYTNLAFEGRSLLFKIASDGQFSEVAALGDTVLVYRGTCKLEARP
jgi:hypothetical protein